MANLPEFVQAQQFTGLQAALESLSSEDAARAGVFLACARRAPASDALLGARRSLREAWDDAPELVGMAARLLASLGAASLGRELLDDASSHPGARSLQGLRERLADGVYEAEDARNVAGHRALSEGALGAASAAFAEAASGAEALAERLDALRMLMRLSRHDGDYAGAARYARRAAEAAPRGDRAQSDAIDAALDTWFAGDHASAIEGLRRVRQSSGDDRPSWAYAAQRAEKLMQHMECDGLSDARPLSCAPAKARVSPSGAAGVRALLLAWTGSEIPELPDAFDQLAQLRRVCEAAAVDVLRVRADAKVVAASIAAGAFILLEEERPLGQAILLVTSFSPGANLIRVREPDAWGDEVYAWKEQERAQSLLSGSALVVLGTGGDAASRREVLASQGIEHDAIFDRLDACVLNPDGEAPPFAEVLTIARAVIEEDPTCQLAHKRGADALLHGVRLGRAEDGAFLAWIGVAREHFPQAEWPHQLYAQWLAGQRRNGEAAIAWSLARTADPWDFRNAHGEAIALAQIGQLDAAENALRWAVSLNGRALALWTWLSHFTLERNELVQADASATLATALAPDHPSAWSARANVLERSGAVAAAIDAFARAAQHDAEVDPWRTLRIARLHCATADFSAAESTLAELHATSSAPEVRAQTALVLARAYLGQGAIAGAVSANADRLERFWLLMGRLEDHDGVISEAVAWRASRCLWRLLQMKVRSTDFGRASIRDGSKKRLRRPARRRYAAAVCLRSR